MAKLYLENEASTQISFNFCFSLCRDRLMSILTTTSHLKMSRDDLLFSLLDSTRQTMATDDRVDVSRVGDAFWGTVRDCMQELVLDRGMR